MKPRRKTIVLGVVLLAFASFSAVLAVLLVVEWLLGGHEGTLADETRRPDPYYSWSFCTSQGDTIGRSGLLRLAMHPFAGYTNLPNQKTAYFTTDARGFRGPTSPATERPANRIVIVGGSTAFGTGLQRDEDSCAARLQSRLAGAEVINAAVIGHLSGQELAYLVSDLLDLRPTLVVAIDGYNDLLDQSTSWPRTRSTSGVNNTFFVIEQRMRQLRELESGGLSRRIGAALPRVFPNTARFLTGGERTPLADQATSWESVTGPIRAPEPGQDIPRHPAALAHLYAMNVFKMQAVASAFGAKFLCALQPDKRSYPGGGEQDLIARSYAAFRAEARKLLTKAAVAHVDLNECRGFAADMFMDSMHLDARGNEVLARILFETIQERGLLAK